MKFISVSILCKLNGEERNGKNACNGKSPIESCEIVGEFRTTLEEIKHCQRPNLLLLPLDE